MTNHCLYLPSQFSNSSSYNRSRHERSVTTNIKWSMASRSISSNMFTIPELLCAMAAWRAHDLVTDIPCDINCVMWFLIIFQRAGSIWKNYLVLCNDPEQQFFIIPLAKILHVLNNKIKKMMEVMNGCFYLHSQLHDENVIFLMNHNEKQHLWRFWQNSFHPPW